MAIIMLRSPIFGRVTACAGILAAILNGVSTCRDRHSPFGPIRSTSRHFVSELVKLRRS